jgi:NitT/TauT family transport system permease protein
MGVLLARNQLSGRIVLPVLDFCRYIPVAALVPLSILWLGVEERQKIVILTAGTFFQALVLVVDAIKRVPTPYLEVGLTLGVSGNRLAGRVLFPAAWPAIFDACRVCAGLTWSYLLVAELVAAELGLGYQIIRAQRFLKTDQIFFIIGVLGLIGFCYDRALLKLRNYVVPWDLLGRLHRDNE